MSGHSRLVKSRAKRKVSFPVPVASTLGPAHNMDPRYQRPGPEFGTPRVPELHLGLPFIMDQLKTETSQKQLHTAESVMKLIGQTPLPGLERAAHARFLSDPLEYGLPSSFTGLDASRPWLLYWCINALALLGEDVGVYRER